MSRNDADDSSRALRFALIASGIVALLAGIGFVALDYYVENGIVSFLAATVASAALSIAGALIVTEYILKPLYVRDVLHVANLSAEIHNVGIRYARPAHGIEWNAILGRSGDITVAIGNGSIFRSGLWVAIMAASRSAQRSVRLHVSEKLGDAGFGPDLERQWRDNGCGAKGSSLSVIPHSEVTQGMVLRCGSWVAATIADDPLNDDPLLLVFTSDSLESAVAAMDRGIERLDGSPTTPIAGA